MRRAPRRRDFKTVPMILNDPDQWDHAALSEVIAYRGAPKQVWDNTGIASPWLNVMRNSLNTQVWSFRHPDFLVVSATHGTAHLALFAPAIWEKYQLAKLTGGKFASNTLIGEPNRTADPQDYENPRGAFSLHDNSIPALQRRGVIFLACHNAIWELAESLEATGVNPDALSQGALAAELTNHLIAGVVLTPGMVGTLPELQQAGFNYANSG
jgi:intracellular sulfur oxidation DsrE/DsrF family protein